MNKRRHNHFHHKIHELIYLRVLYTYYTSSRFSFIIEETFRSRNLTHSYSLLHAPCIPRRNTLQYCFILVLLNSMVCHRH